MMSEHSAPQFLRADLRCRAMSQTHRLHKTTDPAVDSLEAMRGAECQRSQARRDGQRGGAALHGRRGSALGCEHRRDDRDRRRDGALRPVRRRAPRRDGRRAVLAVTAVLWPRSSARCTWRSAAAPTCPTDHPYVQIQNRISDLFGGEAIVIIGVVASQGDIFTPAILGKIYRITDRLRHVTERHRAEPLQPGGAVREGGGGRRRRDDGRRAADGPTPPTTAEAVSARARSACDEDQLFRGNLVSADETRDGDRRRLRRSASSDVRSGAPSSSRVVAPERDDTVTIALAGAPILRARARRATRR